MTSVRPAPSRRGPASGSPVRCGHHGRDRGRGRGRRCPAVDKRKSEVSQAITSLGEYKVQVRLHPEVSATVTVEVVGA
ncbi:50S ribosomal L9 C-terminal domain-containing protein [Cellulomonas sp. NPDC057328]|uniref:50S ribosomal L9 C-terminal domain-containing protein n=1 Tax=Cellulomonas sp. NPDC057328 TaxID=3346101 RepID=UPI003626D9B6